MSAALFLFGLFSGFAVGLLLGTTLSKWHREDDLLDELAQAVTAEEKRKKFATLGYLDGDGQDEYLVVGKMPR